MNDMADIATQNAYQQAAGFKASAEVIQFKSIGSVLNQVDEPRYINWHQTSSTILIDPAYAESLQGLEDYSHLMVIFHMDQACYSKTVHTPQGKHKDVPEVGMFACRCPYRPNPIGVTTVEILGISGTAITVKGLDAVNNTPVIDIKPYTPQYDFVCEVNDEIKKAICEKVRVPEWIFALTY